QIEAVFTAAADRFRAAGRADAAARAAEMVLALRVELRAAQLLRSAGGFPAGGATGGKVAAGPAYVRLTGIDSACRAFLGGLRKSDANDGDLTALLDSILDFDDEKKGGAEPSAHREEPERLFSP